MARIKDHFFYELIEQDKFNEIFVQNEPREEANTEQNLNQESNQKLNLIGENDENRNDENQ